MIEPKRSAEQQVADEADRRALNPMASRQTIADSQAEPEFQANHKRLRADRLAREAAAEPKGEGEIVRAHDLSRYPGPTSAAFAEGASRGGRS
jgi:hypothetical protein